MDVNACIIEDLYVYGAPQDPQVMTTIEKGCHIKTNCLYSLC